ncbi:type II toxin-antitoxin system death-on-curing family toxin [uncultured Gemmiger sp.]|uniref:type II toxin-antitoxin system death-on-curing family toxin n=1 Tax=uncultured Gemmiger sp. TaxID=1623490 RepID=UPI0025CD8775|nr:type II toxin-antitoxin system death-on-curing family toxin [uncultured Gemmiger sp.]
MIRLSTQKILQLHRFLIQETGGLDGLRDEGLLDSAVQGPFATFDGQELYPHLEQKAAKLGYTLAKNHAFLDGNKRIGTYSMLIFLDVNGVTMEYSDDDLISLGFGIADGSMDYEEVLAWVQEYRA